MSSDTKSEPTIEGTGTTDYLSVSNKSPFDLLFLWGKGNSKSNCFRCLPDKNAGLQITSCIKYNSKYPVVCLRNYLSYTH